MLRYVNSFIRNIECPLCLRCGSFFLTKNYFCTKCTDHFLVNYFQKISQTYGSDLVVSSFIQWPKNESDSLSELVYLLKTRTSDCAWEWFVQNLDLEICAVIDPLPNTILLPVPGSKYSHHTSNFAKALQKLTGCRAIHALHKVNDNQNQKRKSVIQRQYTKFELNENFTEMLSTADHIYIIDDIVTTGSTLKNISNSLKSSLYKETGKNVKMSALTLFYRSKAF